MDFFNTTEGELQDFVLPSETELAVGPWDGIVRATGWMNPAATNEKVTISEDVVEASYLSIQEGIQRLRQKTQPTADKMQTPTSLAAAGVQLMAFQELVLAILVKDYREGNERRKHGLLVALEMGTGKTIVTLGKCLR